MVEHAVGTYHRETHVERYMRIKSLGKVTRTIHRYSGTYGSPKSSEPIRVTTHPRRPQATIVVATRGHAAADVAPHLQVRTAARPPSTYSDQDQVVGATVSVSWT